MAQLGWCRWNLMPLDGEEVFVWEGSEPGLYSDQWGGRGLPPQPVGSASQYLGVGWVGLSPARPIPSKDPDENAGVGPAGVVKVAPSLIYTSGIRTGCLAFIYFFIYDTY